MHKNDPLSKFRLVFVYDNLQRLRIEITKSTIGLFLNYAKALTIVGRDFSEREAFNVK